MPAKTILLTTEGTYPHYHGGVSVWCDHLIRNLPGFNFHVRSIVHTPAKTLAFDLAPNVLSAEAIPLWGSEEPAMRHEPFAGAYERRARTTSGIVASRFLPLFRVLARNILAGSDSDPEALGHAMLHLHSYFAEYDYLSSFEDRQTWDAFLADSAASHPHWTLEDATRSLRWLLRYGSVIAAPLPHADICHASMAGLAGLPCVLLKLDQGTPYILTEHGIYLRELYVSLGAGDISLASRRFLLALSQAVVKLNYHYADTVTTLGEFNRKWQLRFGADPAKIELVPNGVSPRIFHPHNKSLPKTPTVVTLARIYPLKGIEVLCKAIVILGTAMPHVRFRILGEIADVPYYERCRKILSDAGVASMVEWSSTRKPAEAYRSAHLFCLPSISEAMPFSVIEAMLCGCPVVATDVGNVQEMLQETGMAVTPNDPEALAGAIGALLSEDGEFIREGLAAAALERALGLYTIESSTDRYRRLYHAAMNEPLPAAEAEAACSR